MSETLNIDEQIKEIDNDLETQQCFLNRGEALKRLKENEDFRLVIFEGYLEVEAQRVFELLTHPLTTKPEEKSSYLSQLETIKNIGRYLGCENYAGIVAITANNAKKYISDFVATKQELIASGKGE